MLPKEALLHQYTAITFSTYIFHFRKLPHCLTNRTIISCFQSVNMKYFLVKRNFSCWCSALSFRLCRVACMLLSERNMTHSDALGGNVSHMCLSGGGEFFPIASIPVAS